MRAALAFHAPSRSCGFRSSMLPRSSGFVAVNLSWRKVRLSRFISSSLRTGSRRRRICLQPPLEPLRFGSSLLDGLLPLIDAAPMLAVPVPSERHYERDEGAAQTGEELDAQALPAERLDQDDAADEAQQHGCAEEDQRPA